MRYKVLLNSKSTNPEAGYSSRFRFWLALWMLLLISGIALGQGRQISGKVTDDTGSELPGVNVLVKGTSSGTITDAEGRYTLGVSGENAVLVFSFIGYSAEEVIVGGRSIIDITLLPDVKQLSEVVVIGYGVQRQEAVTGSVASIKGDVVREVPSANISQALQGRLPGVEFSQTSTQPGATTQIRIRGTRSLTASNDPLVVLDGIPYPGSIGEINPNDIKSIEILKDASATAIYGSRGANGVILVSTKSGKAGQKAQITYNAFYGVKDVFAKYPMMSGPEFVALRTAANQYTNSLDESNDVNTDWQDLLYKTGMVTSHDLGVSGGTDNGSYNFNLGYFEDEGVIPTQQYTRYTIRGALDQGVGKHIRLGFNTYNNYNVTEGSNVGLYNILSMSPIANPYNADGSWKRTIRMPLDETWSYSKDVVEDLADEWLNETRGFGTYNLLYGEANIPGIDGLKYRINLGLNYRQVNNGAFTGQGINATNPTTLSTASIRNEHTTDWTVENLLSYDRAFGQHMINAVALYSAAERQFNQSNVAARDIPSSEFQFYNLGHAAGEITVDPNNQKYEKSGLLSWMGRVMYSYDDRYMISATIRSDGSSRLAPGYKWHTYPAISAGWNIGKEAFIENLNVVDMLKLRVGFGQTSNQAVDPYRTFGRLNPRPYNFGPDNYVAGLYMDRLPNPDLGWEYSKTWNYGLDFALLNNRLSGTIEYYITNTEDLLLDDRLPATSGVDIVAANVGKTQNKGVELSLNGLILDNLNGWTLEAGINFYANRNELIALTSGQTEDKDNWWFVGHPINVIYDYEKVGIWQEGEPHLNILEGSAGKPGMIKVKYTGEYDAEGKPVRAINPDDRQILNTNPDFQGGFNLRLGYKGFDLTTVSSFQSGGILNSTLYSSAGYLNMMNGRRNNVKVDYWTPENTGAKYPKPGGVASGDNPKYGSTLGYFDASYLKIRTLSLGYSFNNNNWMQRAGIHNLRLYVTAQNPFVMFSPYKKESGMDPDTNSYGNENAAVPYAENLRRMLTVGTNAPSTRNYLVGLNITF